MPADDSAPRWERRVLIALFVLVGLILAGVALVSTVVGPPDTSAAKSDADRQSRARMQTFVKELTAVPWAQLTDVLIVDTARRNSIDPYPVERTSDVVTVSTNVGTRYAETVAELCFRVTFTPGSPAGATSTASAIEDVTPCPVKPFADIPRTPSATASG